MAVTQELRSFVECLELPFVIAFWVANLEARWATFPRPAGSALPRVS